MGQCGITQYEVLGYKESSLQAKYMLLTRRQGCSITSTANHEHLLLAVLVLPLDGTPGRSLCVTQLPSWHRMPSDIPLFPSASDGLRRSTYIQCTHGRCLLHH